MAEPAATAGSPVEAPRGIMFHRFHVDGRASGWQGALSADDLDQLVHRVGRDRILDPADWVDALRAGRLRPNDRCLTFDDGLRCQVDVALPVLESHGLRAFWFVFTSVFEGGRPLAEVFSYAATRVGSMDVLMRRFLDALPDRARAALTSSAYDDYARIKGREAPYYSTLDLEYRFARNEVLDEQEFGQVVAEVLAAEGLSVEALGDEIWMSSDDLRMLADAGHEIGLHSHSHPYDISVLEHDEQRRDYERNAEAIEAITGVAPRAVAHPLGGYGPGTLEILTRLGIECGFRCDPSAGLLETRGMARLELARDDAVTLV